MIKMSLLAVFSLVLIQGAVGQKVGRCGVGKNENDAEGEKVFAKLNTYESGIVLKRDVDAMQRFYPEDQVVTNQFAQFIPKKTVLERVRNNMISYDSYEKTMDYLCIYDNVAVMAGVETATVAKDANRSDAGQKIVRRFTETWIKRKGVWLKVARHVSLIPMTN